VEKIANKTEPCNLYQAERKSEKEMNVHQRQSRNLNVKVCPFVQPRENYRSQDVFI
jgi:hypothetical protein